MFDKTKSILVKRTQNGFTLVELLIVIAIISILSTLLFVSYTQIQKNGRDTKRKSDLKTVAAALEIFYSDNTAYPASNGSGNIFYSVSECLKGSPYAAQTWGTGKIECSLSGVLKTYVKQLPKDPIGNVEYCYIADQAQSITGPPAYVTHHRYFLYANMEGKGNRTPNTPPAGCSGSAYNYVIKSAD